MLDGFKAKWSSNPQLAEFRRDEATIIKKFKKLRRENKEPNIRGFAITLIIRQSGNQ